MSQHYSDPSRESDPHALPDIEVWHYDYDPEAPAECPLGYDDLDHAPAHGPECGGWYWQTCLPGCLPDSDPQGPYASEAEAAQAWEESE